MKPDETSPPEADDLADLLVSHSAGEILVAEGASDSRMYLIERGDVELVKSVGPAERIVATLGAGDFFGELCVIEEGAMHLLSARASTDVRVLPLDGVAFDFIVREQPELVMRILHRLASRLRRLDEDALRVHEIAAGVLAAEKSSLPDAGEVLGAVAGRAPAKSKRRKAQTGRIVKAALLHPPTGQRFELVLDGETLVGRFDPQTRTEPDVDLQTLDPESSLSRRHATLWRDDEAFFLREEPGVTNGTFVGKRRVTPGEPCPVDNGQWIRFGVVDLMLEVRRRRGSAR
ncbi:MAG: cyclic nucleotide-binding domain-containing protein [Holophagales bacterium]|nr:cyclic nucleotide-binding domain-containing protein [Holophagales bacterium]